MVIRLLQSKAVKLPWVISQSGQGCLTASRSLGKAGCPGKTLQKQMLGRACCCASQVRIYEMAGASRTCPSVWIGCQVSAQIGELLLVLQGLA